MALGFARTVTAFLIILFGAIILILMSSLGRGAEQAEALRATIVPFLACRFTNTTPQDIPIYSAPVSAELVEIDLMADSLQLTVTKIRNTHVFVRIRSNYGGWVDRDFGVLTGNCDDIPLDETPLSEFSTLCLYRPTERTTLYADSELTQPRDSLQTDGVYVITGQTQTAYTIYISELITGYADKSKGLARGACGLLPMVEG